MACSGVTFTFTSSQLISLYLSPSQTIFPHPSSPQPISFYLPLSEPISLQLSSPQPIFLHLPPSQPISIHLSSSQAIFLPVSSSQPIFLHFHPLNQFPFTFQSPTYFPSPSIPSTYFPKCYTPISSSISHVVASDQVSPPQFCMYYLPSPYILHILSTAQFP